MDDNLPERRTSRSDSIHGALLLQLKASARRAGFSSLVLADDQGLVIACAGNQTIGEYMAALSPGLTMNFKTWHGKVLTNRGRVRLSIAPIKFEESHIYIAATEGSSKEIHKELFASGLGAVRILLN